jgi:glycerol uptake facilitator protein
MVLLTNHHYNLFENINFMGNFMTEFIGTTFLLVLGCGVVANVVLKDTKGHGSGWLVITMGWAMTVFMAVSISSASGAHLNPAVSIAMVMAGKLPSSELVPYISAQMLGALLGSSIVWLMHKDHFDATEDPGTKLAVFATGPAKSNTFLNLLSEFLGTFVLIYAILEWPATTTDLGNLNPLPVALIVLAIGLCLGGTTGYAINPARDLGPRIAHALLPIKGKGMSNWGYSWIPVVGPILGAVAATLLSQAI